MPRTQSLNSPRTFNVRVGADLGHETLISARAMGVKTSAYLREALIEMNRRVRPDPVALEGKRLNARHAREIAAMDGTAGDGLQ